MRRVYRRLHTPVVGCGRYPDMYPDPVAAHGRGDGYAHEGVGHVFDADEPEQSEGDGGLSNDGDGWGHLQAFVSSVSAGETDAIVQRLTP